MSKMTLDVYMEIDRELSLAAAKHGNKKFNSTHEGYAVLKEEVDELWDVIKKNGSRQYLRDEAVQVAAMAVRFIQDLA